MGSNKNAKDKKRFVTAIRKNKPVPSWAVLKTNRTFTYNFKRRDWRHKKIGDNK
ncbi:MAG: 50S ribosomal protein L39e [Nitrososphaeria archaeon]